MASSLFFDFKEDQNKLLIDFIKATKSKLIYKSLFEIPGISK